MEAESIVDIDCSSISESVEESDYEDVEEEDNYIRDLDEVESFEQIIPMLQGIIDTGDADTDTAPSNIEALLQAMRKIEEQGQDQLTHMHVRERERIETSANKALALASTIVAREAQRSASQANQYSWDRIVASIHGDTHYTNKGNVRWEALCPPRMLPVGVPPSAYLGGSLHLGQRRKKTRTKRAVTQRAADERPEEVGADGADPMEGSALQVERQSALLSALRAKSVSSGGQGYPFTFSVLHPTSFARSLESLFDVGQLITTGDITVRATRDVGTRRQCYEAHSIPLGGYVDTQFVFLPGPHSSGDVDFDGPRWKGVNKMWSLSFQDWKKYVALYGVTEELCVSTAADDVYEESSSEDV
eukprot:gnl/Dysnectes_brevis/7016_a11380_274.p1 GENE.gnl/Dysnectes_brevis/7016_a11380_274~~gnl/Dysnectes_brevis/7016_a11380_274.p1  ORF type:complete len:361 (+),score=130.89 gnl/Dysnectes_brevis/7016_a11380_274:98-1180(+)